MKEEEIRKREVFNRYLELVAEDVNELFDFQAFEEVPCPACGGKEQEPAFQKRSFAYVSCRSCQTLFVNPRPPEPMLKKFYAQSRSAKFWVTDFFAPVAEARREKIFRPRAEYVASLLKPESGKDSFSIADIGAGFGLFLEEVEKFFPKSHLIAVEPSPEMAELCQDKGFEVVPHFLEEVEGLEKRCDAVTSFELLEHLFHPESFLIQAKKLLKPSGILCLTTLNGLGFDIAFLWEKSKSVSPPHHLNFFNPRSVMLLLERVGLEVVEVATPGELDWDIFEGMAREEGVSVHRFWREVIENRREECKEAFQKWLVAYNLSSHMRVLARAREGR